MIRGAALILDMTVFVIRVHEQKTTPVVRVESEYSFDQLAKTVVAVEGRGGHKRLR
jgi:hypothetical protein